MRTGNDEDLLYESVTGLQISKENAESGSEYSSSEDLANDSSLSERETDEWKEKSSKLKKHEDKAAKKERKDLAKEQKKEKRLQKIPKSEKKRKQKLAKSKKI